MPPARGQPPVTASNGGEARAEEDAEGLLGLAAAGTILSSSAFDKVKDLVTVGK